MKRVPKKVLSIAMVVTMMLSNATMISATAENWDSSRVYNSGDQVSYNGSTYKAQWWTKNEIPGMSPWGSWKEVESSAGGESETGIPAWKPGKVYNTGMKVKFGDAIYKARYWTQNQQPGKSYDWELVEGNPGGGDIGGGDIGGGETDIEVKGISLNTTSAKLKIGEATSLYATITPSNATDKTVTWSSNNSSVATVVNGFVTAKGAGTAVITAKAGGKTATCTVTVEKNKPDVIEVNSVVVTPSNAKLDLDKNKTIKLNAVVNPEDATDKKVTWNSENTKVAVVDANGNVTAKGEGSTVITAKAGKKTATCTIKVEKGKPAVIEVVSVAVTPSKAELDLDKNKTITLNAVVNPEDATDKKVTWTSGNTKVAVVDANGVVTAKSEGTAVITAKAGKKTATCVVTVKKNVVAVKEVTVTPDKATLEIGKKPTVQLNAKISPENASVKEVIWTSSDEKIAVVSATGLVTAKAAGTAVITAQAGDKFAKSTITVKPGKEINPSELYQTENINGVQYPADYWNRKVVGYFPNYAINSEAHKYFTITDLQWDKLTHVQYAFVIADENTYEMIPCDPVNDVESKFEGRKFYHKGQEIKMDDSLGYYGQFNLMHTMKKMYPDVTVLASTGGWAASRSLWKVTDNEANMNKFADSAVEFVRKYGFDGIDIDFEYPSETSQSGNPADFDLSEKRRKGISERYGQLIKILRDKFDAAAKEDGTYYWVTSAVTGSSWVLGGQTNASYLDYLDFVSVMSYDYHGGWNQFVENQANIYPDPADTETKAMAVPTLGFDWSRKFYRGAVQSEKILMGIPYYTRGWTNVNGGNNGLHGSSKQPATGEDNLWCDLDANGNEIPAGANPLWHVLNKLKDDPNYKKYWDPVGKVPHVWNEKTRTFLTFEDEQSIQERINYIGEHNLGGCLIWVMHGDYDYDPVKKEYTVGDTLTTMLDDQLGAMAPAQLTSDIDFNNDVLDFEVDFGGKYDHPNYTYQITVKNRSGMDFDKWNVSFDLPNSAVYGSSWGGQASTKPSNDPDFTTVTLTPGWQKLPNGASVTLQGMIKLNFAGVKNFKLNGYSQKSEVEAEYARTHRGTAPQK